MLKPQKKLTKKELKEDKFVQTMMDTRVYLEENSKKVTTITLLVFALIVAALIFNYMHGQNVERSSTLLGEAQVEYQNLNLAKAQVLLTRLIEEYGNTNAGAQGKFLLANIYYQQNKIELAKENYRAFVDDYSGSAILLASGYAGYGACLEKENNFSEAGDYYVKAREQNKDFVEAADYLYLAALNYISGQEYGKAREALQLIREKYEDSPKTKEAQGKLILIADK